jgi:hypothetical protein
MKKKERDYTLSSHDGYFSTVMFNGISSMVIIE